MKLLFTTLFIIALLPVPLFAVCLALVVWLRIREESE